MAGEAEAVVERDQLRIAVLSGKGGVGKSSVALLLALALAKSKRTVLVDFDLCGPSAAGAFGVTAPLIKTTTGFAPVDVAERLQLLSFGTFLQKDDAVIWRGPKKRAFLEQFLNSLHDAECVVFDTPPGVSEEHAVLVAAEACAVVVTTPQNVSLNDAQRTIHFAQENGMPLLGIIENNSMCLCAHCGTPCYPFGRRGGALLAAEYRLPLLAELPTESALAAAMDSGRLVEQCDSLHSFALIQQVATSLKLI